MMLKVVRGMSAVDIEDHLISDNGRKEGHVLKLKTVFG